MSYTKKDITSIQKVEDAINKIANKLIPTGKNVKKFETWRIKIDGEFIITARSRKTAWKAIGHAKAALRLHFSHMIYNIELNGYSWREKEDIFEEAYQKFLKERVEFVKID
jgi:hypothetical protein